MFKNGWMQFLWNTHYQQQFTLNKIKEIKNDFVAEIKERELTSIRLSNYIAFFDYFHKSLTVLSVTTGSMSIASFSTVIGALVGIASTSFSLAFLISTWSRKKLLETRNKHNIIVMLARSKSNRIESKIFEALINNEISHEDFMTIINEKIIDN